MANWTGTTMIGSSNQMLESVARMEELNKELMKSVYAYSQAMQDNVKEGTEEMIKKIDALLASIRKEIEERAQKVNEAGKKLSAIEGAAKNKIDSLK